MNPYIYAGLDNISQYGYLNRMDSPIIDVVCKQLEIDYVDLKSPSRKRHLAEARIICAYFLRKYTKLSLAHIGEMLGNRDHSTILYSVGKFSDLVEYDKEFARKANLIESIINKISDNNDYQ